MFTHLNWRARMYDAEGVGGGTGGKVPESDAVTGGSQQDTSQQQGGKVADLNAGQPTGGQQMEKQPLTAEQRHENAARRRAEQEQQRQQRFNALEQELNALKRKMDVLDAFAKANNYKSVDEMVEQEMNLSLKNGEITVNHIRAILGAELSKYLDSHPTVQAASQLIQQQQAQAIVDEDMREFLSTPEFAEFGIQTPADFVKKMPADKFQIFYKYVSENYSFKDAFAKAYEKELQEKRSNAAKQSVLNNLQGKEHLKPADGGTDGISTVIVPDAVKAEYRRYNPGMKDEEIARHYARFIKSQEKGTG